VKADPREALAAFRDVSGMISVRVDVLCECVSKLVAG
jgi:hypothetical protein